MNIAALIPFAAAALAVILALANLVRKTPSLATWCFAGGMTLLGLDSVCTGLALRASAVADFVGWLAAGLLVKSFLPAVWLTFSLSYSRGDQRRALAGWALPITLVGLIPIVLAVGFRTRLLELIQLNQADGLLMLHSGAPAKAFHASLLISWVLALMNLEQTFRASVGTMRWRIKYVVLGLGVTFGAQIFVRSQAILYSAYDPILAGVELSGLFVGCILLVLAYARTGLAEIDAYPSRAVLRSSITVLVVGGYLFIVGVLAQTVRRFGGAESFQLQAFVVLVGLAGLAVLLLSDRIRQHVHALVSRHFRKAQHDSVRIWSESSRRFANVQEPSGLASSSTTLISAYFEALSVTAWLLDEQSAHLVLASATSAHAADQNAAGAASTCSATLVAGLQNKSAPFDLDVVSDDWGDEWRLRNPAAFPNGGHRWCVPLRSGVQTLGALVLGDRVNGTPYSEEELQLLQCIADQISSVLLNLRLANEVARGRELEAFQTMSAFFVHDLKNAAASLNLMLKNLPVHFDDPAFRADALRGIGNTARRIDEMITRLGSLRQRPAVHAVRADLNQLVTEAVDRLDGMMDVELTRELHATPAIAVDVEQILSVVTNLLMNARDALGPSGRIHVSTDHENGRVVLSVADNGCGMSQEFVRCSLFRPFQSTKSKGLGIGMFQSRMVVEAHGGSIQVDSEQGKGTTVRVTLPASDAA